MTEVELDAFLRDVKGTRFSDITEFGRAVHAEMDALTTAARLGTPVSEGTVVCTTFPCHGCTRHLIASGIRRIVFIYPYAKSLARELHEDAIVFEPETPGSPADKVVMEQYIGVAPRCYPQYFDFRQASRKDGRGRAMQAGDPRRAIPRVLQDGGTFAFGGPAVPRSHIARLEKAAAKQFESAAKHAALTVPTPAKETGQA